jgi:hypothetical protein
MSFIETNFNMIFVILIVVLCVTILTVSLVTYFNNREPPMNPLMDYVETNTVVTDLSLNGTVYADVRGTGVVDWGDGESTSFDSEGVNVIVDHTYASLGTYTVKFSGKLTVLVLSGNEGTGEGGLKSTYLKLLQCPNLLALTTFGVTSITGLEKCTKLTVLSLRNSNIKVLNLSRNTQLGNLSLSACQIEELQGLTSLTKLVIVEIRSTSVQNLVPDFTFASDLNYLDLRDSGISSLLVPESSIDIDIRFNNFTIEDLNALATLLNTFGSKPESGLDIYGNPGTPEVNLENEPWLTLVNNGWNVSLDEVSI